MNTISEEWARQLIFNLTGNREAEQVYFLPRYYPVYRVTMPDANDYPIRWFEPSDFELKIEDIQIKKAIDPYGYFGYECHYIGYGEKSKIIVVCGGPEMLSERDILALKLEQHERDVFLRGGRVGSSPFDIDASDIIG